MIRRGKPEDEAAVMVLLRESREGAGFDRPDGLTGFEFPYSAAHAQRVFWQHLTHKDGLVLVFDLHGKQRGILLAFAIEHPFGPVVVAHETTFWISPNHRGGTAASRMIDAYEEWALNEKGGGFTGLVGMGEDPEIAKLYRRKGYLPAELHFLKRLKRG